MRKLNFRSLCPEDIERVLEIDSSNVGHSLRGFFDKHMTAAIDAPEDFITCAACDCEKILGFAIIRMMKDDFVSAKAVAVIDTFSVDPAVRGQGIAKSLMVGIEHRVAKRNTLALRAEIDWTNYDLIRFLAETHFVLAPIQIATRDTSLFPEIHKGKSRVKIGGHWQALDAGGTDQGTQHRDKILYRSLKEEDLENVVHLDQKLSGRDHSSYFHSKFQRSLLKSGTGVSLVAEKKDILIGFIMARIDCGGSDKPNQIAVIDTIGVLPAEKKTGIDRALLTHLLLNLSKLQIGLLHTQIEWHQLELRKFLQNCDFELSQRLVLEKQITGAPSSLNDRISV